MPTHVGSCPTLRSSVGAIIPTERSETERPRSATNPCPSAGSRSKLGSGARVIAACRAIILRSRQAPGGGPSLGLPPGGRCISTGTPRPPQRSAMPAIAMRDKQSCARPPPGASHTRSTSGQSPHPSRSRHGRLTNQRRTLATTRTDSSESGMLAPEFVAKQLSRHSGAGGLLLGGCRSRALEPRAG